MKKLAALTIAAGLLPGCGPMEMAIVVIPLGALFGVIYGAVRLATRDRRRD